MIDVKKVKEQLTLEDYESIINALEIPITAQSYKIWSLKSGCHSIDCNDCDSNLKFNIEKKTFTCYSHECLIGQDIFDLVLIRQQLFNPKFTFIDAVNFVIDNSNISISNVTKNSSKKSNNFNIKQLINKYTKHETESTEVKIYNEKVLNFLSDTYKEEWINENITIDTMKKYEIKYYERGQQVCIPIRNENGDLIGIHCRNFLPEELEYGRKYIPLKLLDGTEYNFPTSNVLYGLYQNKDIIKRFKKVILFEAPKSVLKLNDISGGQNIGVALFGMSFSKAKAQLLIDLGVEECIVAIDKEYDIMDSEEFNEYKNKVLKIAKFLKGFMRVSVMYDKENLLDKKDSPIDKGEDIFYKLYDEREAM